MPRCARLHASIFEGVYRRSLDVKREALAEGVGAAPGTDVYHRIHDLDHSGRRYFQARLTHPRALSQCVHWLNPAYLDAAGRDCRRVLRRTPAVTARLKTLLEGIGKIPVVCAATPGYIVPRIQALAMNEAARMVEEGVASCRRYRQGNQATASAFALPCWACSSSSTGAAAISCYYASQISGRARSTASVTAAPQVIIGRNMHGRKASDCAAAQGFLDYSAEWTWMLIASSALLQLVDHAPSTLGSQGWR